MKAVEHIQPIVTDRNLPEGRHPLRMFPLQRMWHDTMRKEGTWYTFTAHNDLQPPPQILWPTVLFFFQMLT